MTAPEAPDTVNPAPAPDRPPSSADGQAFPRRLERLAAWVTPVRVGLLVAVAVATVLTASLDRYGITSDSPALFYAGDRTLFWLQHLNMPGALDYDGPEPRGFHTRYGRHPDIKDPNHYPVLPGFAAAVTNWIFHVKLGWLDHIDGHHLGLVLLHALSLFLFCLYACKLLGKGAGIAATAALALFPVGLGHAPNNAKDWPCAMFYGLTILAAAVGVLQEKPRHLVAAGVFWGVALAAKMNAAFIAPTMLLWAPIAWFALYWRKRRGVPATVVGAFLLAPWIALVTFWVTWPWLYYGRLPQWWEHFAEYVRFMVNYGSGQRPGWTLYPLTCAVLMTPPVVLFAALAWLGTGWRGRKNFALWSLLLIWFALPILRIAMPKSNFYDANRHFIEYVPALATMAGIGFAWALRRLREWLRSERMTARLGARASWAGPLAAGVVGFVCVVWPAAEYHPYQTVYFNACIGGLGGAQQAGLFNFGPPSDIRVLGTEGDYWFSSAREGARDLRAFMKPGSKISMCGPGREHARYNWQLEPMPHLVEAGESDWEMVEYLYVSPRESLCWWRQVRRMEGERPVLKRVERGGGLVYEILGPKDGVARVPPSPETWYERNPDPRDGMHWYRYNPPQMAKSDSDS